MKPRTPIKFKEDTIKRGSRSPFKQSRRLKVEEFNPRLYVTPKINEESVIAIKQAFDSFDFNGVGLLNPNDLKMALSRHNFHASRDTVYNIMAEYDQQIKGALDFADFMAIICTQPTQKETVSELKKVFRQFDRRNIGVISKSDLQDVLRELGDEMTESELQRMIQKIDRSGKGSINFDDFCRVMHHPSSYY